MVFFLEAVMFHTIGFSYHNNTKDEVKKLHPCVDFFNFLSSSWFFFSSL